MKKYYKMFEICCNQNYLFAAAILYLLSATNIMADNFWGLIPSPNCGNVNVLKINRSNQIFASVWGFGLKHSSDNGTSWTDINTGLTSKYVRCIEYDSSGTIYIGTFDAGVFKSTNNGNNWTQIIQGLSNLNVKAITIHPKGWVFAGTYGSGVYRSSDGGANWSSSSKRLWFRDVNAFTIAADSGILVGLNGQGIYKSKDLGDTWLSSSGGLESLTINTFLRHNGEIFVSTMGGNLYSSVANGANWKIYDSTSIYVDPQTSQYWNITKNVNAIVMNSKRELVVSTTDVGVGRHEETTDSWKVNVFGGSGANSLAVNSNGILFASAPYYGIYSSTNFGKDWLPVSAPLNDSLRLKILASFKDGTAFLTIENTSDANNLYKTTDYGKTWSKLTFNKLIKAFALDSIGNLYIGTSDGLYKSINNGDDWALNNLTILNITSIAVNKNGNLYVGYTDKPEPPGIPTSFLYKSTNGGIDWSEIYPSNQLGQPILACNNNGEVYLHLASSALYKSSDNGNNWAQVDDITGLYYFTFNSNNHIWALPNKAVLRTTNDGSNWTKYNFGQAEDPFISNLVVTPGSNVYATPYWDMGAVRTVNNGTKWDTVVSGMIENRVWGMTSSKEGALYISTNVLYSTTDVPSMVAPTLVYPNNFNKAVPVDPVFIWNKAKRADMYEMQIAMYPNFDYILEKAVLSDTSYSLIYLLANNTDYYWRVRSKTNSAYSPWSQTFTFRTILDTAVLIYPPNNSGGHNTDVNFVWYNVYDALEFTLQVSEDPTFATTFINRTKIPDTTTLVQNLKLYTKYYWRVKANNSFNESRWSEVWNFKTKLRVPGLRSPANHSYGHLTEVAMTWDAVEGGKEYYIQIAKDSLFNTMIYDGKSSQLLTHTISLLEYFTKYYWRVYAKDDQGISDWSEVWDFTTIIEAPTLIKPLDSTVDAKTSIDFEWSQYDKATGYHLQISDNKNFSNIIYEDSTLTAVELNVPGLEYYKTYYWRVRIKVNQYWGLWSNVWFFSTGIDKPILKDPVNDAVNVPRALYLQWKLVTGAKYYHAQIATDISFANILKEIPDAKGDNLGVTALEPLAKYYWRVKAFYDFGESEWSDIWSFTTNDASAVETSNILEQFDVYPNPFSDYLIFNINLNTASNLKIELFDAKGIGVELIHNDFRNAGNAVIRWERDGLMSGLYLCKITAGEAVLFKELISIK